MQLAVHPNWEGGMGSRSVFRIEPSLATSFRAHLELCAKRTREMWSRVECDHKILSVRTKSSDRLIFLCFR